MPLSSRIILKNGDELTVTDKNVIANSASVSMSTCGNSFDVGTFNAATLKIGIYDDDALEREYDGATIKLQTIDDEEVTTMLGTYYVDGEKSQRKKNMVNLVARDASVFFDAEFDDSLRTSSFTAQTAITKACELAGVPLVTTDFSTFPNTKLKFSLASKSIQTLRDIVMWSAQLICANAVINRGGGLELRSPIFSGKDEKLITGRMRRDITFSDVRTNVKYLTAYKGKTPTLYSSAFVPKDAQCRAGELSLPFNPLLEETAEDSVDNVNKNWLSYIETFYPRKVKATLFSNSEIQLGDLLRFSGGCIDVRRSIVAVVTQIKWTYRGMMTVICAAPTAVKEEEVT